MYLHSFNLNILRLELSKLLHDNLQENDILQLEIKINGKENKYSARIDYKGMKYIYVELIDEIIKADEITFVQQL